MLGEFGVGADQHHDVAYGGRPVGLSLDAGFAAGGVIVVFGGFDSYIEEWLPMLLALRDAGQDVSRSTGRARARRWKPACR